MTSDEMFEKITERLEDACTQIGRLEAKVERAEAAQRKAERERDEARKEIEVLRRERATEAVIKAA